MLQTWRTIAFHSLVAASLFAVPARAAEPGPDDEKINEILRTIKEIKGDLKELETIKADLGRMRTDRDMTDIKVDNALKDLQDIKEQVRSTKEQLANLDREMRELRNRVQTSRSMFGPAETGTGRIRLVNSYDRDVHVIVNGKTYRLYAYETRLSDPIPSGKFQYEVLVDGFGSITQGERSRTLAPNEIFEVKINMPR